MLSNMGMMKTIKPIVCVAVWIAFTACSGSSRLPDEDGTPTTGRLLSIGFEQQAGTSTRATATSPSEAPSTALASGIQFKACVYNKETTVDATTAPLAQGAYKVSGDGSTIEAVGDPIKLFAGTYDFYFVSYNSTTDSPDTDNTSGNTSLISNLTNGSEFLYAAMQKVEVRSAEAGTDKFIIKLDKPFSRLTSAMKVSVRAKEGTHPVTPTSLAVKSIQVTGLSEACSFVPGKNALEAPTGGYSQDYTFPEGDFTVENGGTSSDVTLPRTSGKYLILPTDGSTELHFTVTLTVGYEDSSNGNQPVTGDFVYEIPYSKSLLAGTSYEFAFSLTFFDHYLPGNLELDVLPFVEVPTLETDPVGS